MEKPTYGSVWDVNTKQHGSLIPRIIQQNKACEIGSEQWLIQMDSQDCYSTIPSLKGPFADAKQNIRAFGLVKEIAILFKLQPLNSQVNIEPKHCHIQVRQKKRTPRIRVPSASQAVRGTSLESMTLPSASSTFTVTDVRLLSFTSPKMAACDYSGGAISRTTKW